jgi:hypothetical protein
MNESKVMVVVVVMLSVTGQEICPDLVSCPFCPFAAEVDVSTGREFHCQNPTCLRVSCRLCGDAAHAPLRCDEVEKRSQVPTIRAMSLLAHFF